MNVQFLLLLAGICAATTIGRVSAATRIALVDSEKNSDIETVIDSTIALLSKDTDLQTAGTG